MFERLGSWTFRFRFPILSLPSPSAVGVRSFLLWMEDRNGNRTQLEYAGGRLDRVVDPLMGHQLVQHRQARAARAALRARARPAPGLGRSWRGR